MNPKSVEGRQKAFYVIHLILLENEPQISRILYDLSSSVISGRVARTRLDLDYRSKIFAPTRPSFQIENFRPDSTWFPGQHFRPRELGSL